MFVSYVRIVCSIFAKEVFVMKKQIFHKITVYIALPAVILMCCLFLSRNTEAESSTERVDDVVSYESVLICKGDTLWSIARASLEDPTNEEIQAFVEEIASLNRISSANIHAGHYLLVPKYSSLSSSL